MEKDGIVKSKYLSMLTIILIETAGLIIGIALCNIYKNNIDNNKYFFIVLTCAYISIIYIAIFYSLAFKYGVEKGKFKSSFLACIIIFAVFGFCILLVGGDIEEIDNISLDGLYGKLTIILTIIVVIILTISYNISKKIFNTKEF